MAEPFATEPIKPPQEPVLWQVRWARRTTDGKRDSPVTEWSAWYRAEPGEYDVDDIPKEWRPLYAGPVTTENPFKPE